MPVIEPDLSRWTVSLGMDALYFGAANAALAQAGLARKAVRQARMALQALESEEAQLKRRAMRSANARDRLEGLAIQIVDGAIPRYEAAYRPYLEALAVCHISSAASLEAYLNKVAGQRLSSVEHGHFDRLSLDGKWLTLPAFLGLTPRAASDHRYGRVKELVNFRNGLVHYKSRSEEWRQGRAPKFVKKLGLAYPAAVRSIATVREAVRATATALGDDEPLWIGGRILSYFVQERL